MFCSLVPYASAAQREEIQPMWTYLTRITGSLDISSGGTASVTAKVKAESGEVARVAMNVSLQRYVSGAWKEMKSWDVSSNSASVSLSEKKWQVYHGYSYRAVVTTKVYNENALLEQATKTISYGYYA